MPNRNAKSTVQPSVRWLNKRTALAIVVYLSHLPLMSMVKLVRLGKLSSDPGKKEAAHTDTHCTTRFRMQTRKRRRMLIKSHRCRGNLSAAVLAIIFTSKVASYAWKKNSVSLHFHSAGKAYLTSTVK